jgi:exodeoxyribonuclease VII small subunit
MPDPSEAPPDRPDPLDPPPEDYGRALAELEAILAALERDDLDVDAMAERVARAAGLLRWCRSRLGDTRLEIERIVTELET